MVNAKKELVYAQGMIERRQDVIEGLGKESNRYGALASYRTLAGCLREVQRHHNNIMAGLDDKSAGPALETSLLVDVCKGRLAQSARVCEGWGVSPLELAGIRTVMGV